MVYKINRSMTSVITVVVILMVLPTCDSSHVEEDGMKVPQEVPFVLIWRTPEYPRPDEPIISGVMFVAWTDGTAIRPASMEKLGRPYRRGKIEEYYQAQLRTAVQRLCDRAASRKDELVVDAAAIHIRVRGACELNESLPLSRDSLAQPILLLVESMTLKEERSIDFDGRPLPKWVQK